MILLLIRCPRCGKKQKWLSYKIKNLTELYGKTVNCKVCPKCFTIKGETVDRIVKVITFDRNR